jgi:hypothetical protein
MNVADLHRLCDALDECGGLHRFTAVVDAAAQVWQAAERRPKPTVERWEDGPHIGAGMSDKVVRAWMSSSECEPGVPHEWHDVVEGEMCASCCATRKTLTVSSTASIAPEGAEAARRVMERRCSCFDTHPPSETCPTCEDQFLEVTPRRNPAPIMSERGERKPLPKYDCQDDPHEQVLVRHRELAAEYRNGCSNAPDSPILSKAQSDFGRRLPPRHMPPVDPTIEAGDPA